MRPSLPQEGDAWPTSRTGEAAIESALHAFRWHWIADSNPANSVSLRSVTDGNFVVVDVTEGKH
jgi:hypothetical protein